MTVNKKEIGKLFKQDAQPINLALEALTEEDKERYRNEMDQNKEIVIKTASGKELKLTADLVQFEQYEKNIQEVKYTPSVIEPSFGIGRIVYCIFEHCFKVRAEDEQRTYFVFPPLVAPLKCSILPLIDKPVLNKVVQDISKTILM
jgi:glycyl-tRNA synthetase